MPVAVVHMAMAQAVAVVYVAAVAYVVVAVARVDTAAHVVAVVFAGVAAYAVAVADVRPYKAVHALAGFAFHPRRRLGLAKIIFLKNPFSLC